ncbi:MAG TPA: hypothetical protein VE961_23660 [Pyrinomonadaceae bacterium]|nr:hypothetical protein [Pyrinomonadaceae bacterium]
MTDNTEKTSENGHADEQTEIAISYVKSNFFRVIHADGAWGGVSPHGDIHISFYSERAAIPDASKLTVSDKTGAINEEHVATSEIVREVESDVVVDLNTAIRIRAWLDDKIKGLQLLVKQAQEKNP